MPKTFRDWLHGMGIQTARELAAKANISTQAAYPLMRGTSEPTGETLKAVGLERVVTYRKVKGVGA